MLILKYYENIRFPGNKCRAMEIEPYSVSSISDYIMVITTCRASFIYFVSDSVLFSLTMHSQNFSCRYTKMNQCACIWWQLLCRYCTRSSSRMNRGEKLQCLTSAVMLLNNFVPSTMLSSLLLLLYLIYKNNETIYFFPHFTIEKSEEWRYQEQSN